MSKKVRGSTATYKEEGDLICDLEELTKEYSKVINIPERLNLTKAYEISLLAQAFLILYKKKEK